MLDAQVSFLQDIGVDTSKLAPLEAINAEQLVVLRQIRDIQSAITPAARGFEGIINRPRMFLAGEAGPERVSIQPINSIPSRGSKVVEFNLNLTMNGSSSSEEKRFIAREIKEEIFREMRQGQGRELFVNIKRGNQ